VKAALAYGAVAALVMVVLATLVMTVVPGAEPGGLWVAAAIAWTVQMASFPALVVGRRAEAFMLSWAAGMALRFAAVVGVAFWVTRTVAFDPPTTLVGLVGFVFLLVLLEPLFLRLAD
jgi:hypothetical protein